MNGYDSQMYNRNVKISNKITFDYLVISGYIFCMFALFNGMHKKNFRGSVIFFNELFKVLIYGKLF